MKKFLMSLTVISIVSFLVPIQCSQVSPSISKNNKTKNTTSTKETKTTISPEVSVINRIEMLVYTDDEPIIITKFDCEKKSLDGQVRSSNEVLFDRLKYYEATNYYKISGYQEDAEKHLAAIKSEHGLDDDGLVLLAKESGRTFEELLEELRMVYAIRRLMQELITNRIVVSEKEIKEYFNAHPVTVPSSYKVRKGTINKESMTEKDLELLFKTRKNQEDIVWGVSYWISENELAEHKKFITQMSIDQIALSDELDKEYEVVQLLKIKVEHTKTFEERYNEILQILRYPKYEELMKSYEEELLKKYEVVRY